jgi:hypothetical protein
MYLLSSRGACVSKRPCVGSSTAGILRSAPILLNASTIASNEKIILYMPCRYLDVPYEYIRMMLKIVMLAWSMVKVILY